jgi:hypothetical protein
MKEEGTGISPQMKIEVKDELEMAHGKEWQTTTSA